VVGTTILRGGAAAVWVRRPRQRPGVPFVFFTWRVRRRRPGHDPTIPAGDTMTGAPAVYYYHMAVEVALGRAISCRRMQ
jgi:hypothetical protein